MANASQFQYELVEVCKMLLKKEGIIDGKWSIGVNFNMAVTLAGPDPEKIRPSIIIGVDQISINKAPGDATGPLIVDASDAG